MIVENFKACQHACASQNLVVDWSWMIVENFKACQQAYACLSKSELGRGLVVDGRGKFLSMSACLCMLEQVRTWSWIGRGWSWKTFKHVSMLMHAEASQNLVVDWSWMIVENF